MHRHRVSFVVLALGLWMATTSGGPATARGWHTQQWRVGGKRDALTSHPVVAMAEDGGWVAAARASGTAHVLIATGGPRRSTQVRTAEGATSDPASAVGPGGRVLVAWEAGPKVTAVLRDPAGRWTSRDIMASSGFAFNAVQVARDRGGGWYLAERYAATAGGPPFHIRVATLANDGRVRFGIQDLGLGQFALDPRRQPALVARQGEGGATLAFTQDGPDGLSGPARVKVVRASARGKFGLPVTLEANTAVADPFLAPDGLGLVSATAVARCSEASCFGPPAIWTVGPSGAASVAAPRVPQPLRTFNSAALSLSGRRFLELYQELAPGTPDSRLGAVLARAWTPGASAKPRQVLARAGGMHARLAGSPERPAAIWLAARGLYASLGDSRGTMGRPSLIARADAGEPSSSPLDVASNGARLVVAWISSARLHVAYR
jgi:hypothetical protein